MAKRDEAMNLIVVAALVAVSVGLLYFMFRPKASVVKGDARLVETVETAGTTGSRGMIKVIDNVNFDLDKFEPKDDVERMLLNACKYSAISQAAAETYSENVDNYQSDMKNYFSIWSKVVFYETKGEYKKAIMLLVELSKKDVKSLQFKGKVYLKLSEVLATAGDKKQSLKAMLRYYETMEEDAKKIGGTDELKSQRVQLMKQLNAMGGL